MWMLAIFLFVIATFIIFNIAYVAIHGSSVKYNDCLFYESITNPNHYYQYHQLFKDGEPRPISRQPGAIAFICSGCHAERSVRARDGNPDRKVNQIGVRDGEFISNPDDQRHICRPISKAEYEKRNIYRGETRAAVGTNISGFQFKQRINTKIASLPAHLIPEVQQLMPDDRSLGRMGRRAAMPLIPQTCTLDDIDEVLKSSCLTDGGILAHFNQGGNDPFLLMMDDKCIEIFRAASEIVIDGTFDSAPKKDEKIYQIYTIMAVFTVIKKYF